mgnify:CR=1 FL=1
MQLLNTDNEYIIQFGENSRSEKNIKIFIMKCFKIIEKSKISVLIFKCYEQSNLSTFNEIKDLIPLNIKTLIFS